jgi:hypothetical protein
MHVKQNKHDHKHTSPSHSPCTTNHPLPPAAPRAPPSFFPARLSAPCPPFDRLVPWMDLSRLTWRKTADVFEACGTSVQRLHILPGAGTAEIVKSKSTTPASA